MSNTSKIRIVTDSSSDIPSDLAAKYAIKIIPMYVGYDGNLLKDLFEIKPEQVYAALEAGKKVNTSSPSVGDFIFAFKKLIEQENAQKIYCITLSSKLSAAYSAANIAKNSFPPDMIKIFDSKTSTMCLGLIALQAAEAVNKNLSYSEIEKLISELIIKSKFIAVLESLEYVFKGGRVVFLSKFLSKAIKFIPILNIGRDGKVKLRKFVKNKEKAILEIYSQAVSAAKLNNDNIISIFYGSDITPAKELERLLRQNTDISISDLIINKITTVISAHTGPGIWGVAVSPKLV